MIKEKFDLSGKKALVTGGGRGIGEAISLALAEAGADVAIMSRKQAALDATAEKIKEYGVAALAVAGHVGKSEDVKRVVAEVKEAFGGIDILVNNAATNPALGPAIFVDDKIFDKIFEVNVKGPFMMIKAVQPIMSEQGGGTIINLASTAGISPAPMLGVYSVSKSAVIGMSKMFAGELGCFGIRVNVVAPGLIKTDFSQAIWSSEAVLKDQLAKQPIPRIGETIDPAAAVLFLASEASSFMTGSVIVCDGGSTI
jgi:dehydrogenase/reductase SDR family member 4